MFNEIKDKLLLNWTKQFRKISTAVKQTEVVGVKTLKSAVNLAPWHFFDSKQTMDIILNALIAAAFSKNNRHVYDKRLTMRRQNNFSLIQQYVQSLIKLYIDSRQHPGFAEI